MKARIILVEDSSDIANLVAINLRMMDHQVDVFQNARQAMRQFHQPYDMAIFDIMLPGDISGLDLCRQLRHMNETIPIMMVTAKSSEQDIVMGLETGADDYLLKPFSVLELQARVKAHLRRLKSIAEVAEPEPLKFEHLEINPLSRVVALDKQQIDLTATEFDLLWHLASQPGRAFSREQLLDQVWGHQHAGYAHTVNSTVNRLRNKVEPDPAHPHWIQTVWGVGYRFSSHY